MIYLQIIHFCVGFSIIKQYFLGYPQTKNIVVSLIRNTSLSIRKLWCSPSLTSKKMEHPCQNPVPKPARENVLSLFSSKFWKAHLQASLPARHIVYSASLSSAAEEKLAKHFRDSVEILPKNPASDEDYVTSWWFYQGSINGGTPISG